MTEGQKNQMAASNAPLRVAPDPYAGPRRVFCIVACVVLGLSVTLAYLHLPGPPCLVRLLCHIPCPGCGLTRSFKTLCGGNVVDSLRYHPLGLPLFALLTMYAVSIMAAGSFSYFRTVRDRIEAAVLNPKFWLGATVLLISVWVVRMGLAGAGNTYFWW